MPFNNNQKDAIEFLVGLKEYFKGREGDVLKTLKDTISEATPENGYDDNDVNNLENVLKTFALSGVDAIDQAGIAGNDVPEIRKIITQISNLRNSQTNRKELAKNLLDLYGAYENTKLIKATLEKTLDDQNIINNEKFVDIRKEYGKAKESFEKGNYGDFRAQMRNAVQQLDTTHFLALRDVLGITKDDVNTLLNFHNDPLAINNYTEFAPIYFGNVIGKELVVIENIPPIIANPVNSNPNDGNIIADAGNTADHIENNNIVADASAQAKAEVDKRVAVALDAWLAQQGVPAELRPIAVDQALAVRGDAVDFVNQLSQKEAGVPIDIDQTVVTILTFAKINNYYQKLDDKLKENGITKEEARQVIIAFIFKQYKDGENMSKVLEGKEPFIALKNWAYLQPDGGGLSKEDVDKLEKLYGENKEKVNAFMAQMDADLINYKVSQDNFDNIKEFAYEKLGSVFKDLYDRLSIKEIDTTDPIGKSMTTESKGFWASVGQFFLDVLYVLGPILLDFAINYLQSRSKMPGLDFSRPQVTDLSAEQVTDAQTSLYAAGLLELASQKLTATEFRNQRRGNNTQTRFEGNFDGFAFSDEKGLNRQFKTLDISAKYVQLEGKRVKKGTIWATYLNDDGQYCADKIEFVGDEAKCKTTVKLNNGQQQVRYVKLGNENGIMNSETMLVKKENSKNQYVWVGKNFVTEQYEHTIGFFGQKSEQKFIGYQNKFDNNQMFKITVEFPTTGGTLSRKLSNGEFYNLTETFASRKTYYIAAENLKDLYATNGTRFTYQKAYGEFKTYVKNDKQYAINTNVASPYQGYTDIGKQVNLKINATAYVHVTLHNNAEMRYKDQLGKWQTMMFDKGDGNYQIPAWKLKTAVAKNMDLAYYEMGKRFIPSTAIPSNNQLDNKKYLVVYNDTSIKNKSSYQ